MKIIQRISSLINGCTHQWQYFEIDGESMGEDCLASMIEYPGLSELSVRVGYNTRTCRCCGKTETYFTKQDGFTSEGWQ